MVGVERFNLTASNTCCKQLPPVYTKRVWMCVAVHVCSHVCLCACVGPCPLCVRGILTVYWQDVDYLACGGWGLPGRQVGVTAPRSDETIRQRGREREEGMCQGQRTMTISCRSQLTWTQRYQDQIIYSNALKCDVHKQTHMPRIYMHFRYSPSLTLGLSCNNFKLM